MVDFKELLFKNNTNIQKSCYEFNKLAGISYTNARLYSEINTSTSASNTPINTLASTSNTLTNTQASAASAIFSDDISILDIFDITPLINTRHVVDRFRVNLNLLENNCLICLSFQNDSNTYSTHSLESCLLSNKSDIYARINNLLTLIRRKLQAGINIINNSTSNSVELDTYTLLPLSINSDKRKSNQEKVAYIIYYFINIYVNYKQSYLNASLNTKLEAYISKNSTINTHISVINFLFEFSITNEDLVIFNYYYLFIDLELTKLVKIFDAIIA